MARTAAAAGAGGAPVFFSATLLLWLVSVVFEIGFNGRRELTAVIAGALFYQAANWVVRATVSRDPLFVNTCVSLVHAAVTSFSVILVLLNEWMTSNLSKMFEHSQLVGGNRFGAYTALCFSCGYFAYDQLDMLRYHLYTGWIPSILVHHLILLVCFTLALYRNATINYLMHTLVSKVSTDGFVVVVLLLSAIYIWIFSLFIVLVGWFNAPKFPTSSNGKQKVLIVIAHPDDESMFFTPTILHLISEGHRVQVLCLSTGNADGEGSVRKIELYKACFVLKIPFENVKVVDLPTLQDGFCQVWSHQLLAKIVEDEIFSHGVNLLITFDKYGVSHHPNHCDVHYGICMLLRDKARNLEAWELVTTNILRKYSGPVDIWLAFIYNLCCERQLTLLVNKFPSRSFLAMAKHGSQWVWFRKLFVVFSSYTYVNTLRKISV